MSKQTPHILIVEDTVDVAEIIKLAFRRTELFIHHELNGMDGLKYLETNLPDVIVLDLGMPGLSGWEFLDRVRLVDHLKNIPVIILTAHVDAENRQISKRYNVAAYLHKPIDLGALRNAIDDSIYLKR